MAVNITISGKSYDITEAFVEVGKGLKGNNVVSSADIFAKNYQHQVALAIQSHVSELSNVNGAEIAGAVTYDVMVLGWNDIVSKIKDGTYNPSTSTGTTTSTKTLNEYLNEKYNELKNNYSSNDKDEFIEALIRLGESHVTSTLKQELTSEKQKEIEDIVNKLVSGASGSGSTNPPGFDSTKWAELKKEIQKIAQAYVDKLIEKNESVDKKTFGATLEGKLKEGNNLWKQATDMGGEAKVYVTRTGEFA